MNPFKRTTCDCALCCVGCKTKPGALAPGDAEAIAEHVTGEELTEEFLVENFEASEGALVMNKMGQTFRVPSIVPRLTENGCVFLDEDGKCKVHPVSPFGCSHMDFHMSRAESDNRLNWFVREQMEAHVTGGRYAWHVKRLHDKGKIARPLKERQGNFIAEAKRIEDEEGES